MSSSILACKTYCLHMKAFFSFFTLTWVFAIRYFMMYWYCSWSHKYHLFFLFQNFEKEDFSNEPTLGVEPESMWLLIRIGRLKSEQKCKEHMFFRNNVFRQKGDVWIFSEKALYIERWVVDGLRKQVFEPWTKWTIPELYRPIYLLSLRYVS